MLTAQFFPNVGPSKGKQDMLNIHGAETPYLAALPFPDIDPVIFSIGIFSVRWYALAYLTGILLGWGLLRHLTKSPQDPIGRAPIDDLINFGIVGIIIG